MYPAAITGATHGGVAGLGLGESQAGLSNPDLTGPRNDAIEPVSADKADASGLEGLEDRPLEIAVTTRQKRHPWRTPEEVAHLVERTLVVAIVQVVQKGLRIERANVERLALRDQSFPYHRAVERTLVLLLRVGPINAGMIAFVALAEVQDVLIGATYCCVQIAPGLGFLVASLFGEFFVAADCVHRGDALPCEIAARGSAGLAATLGVDDGEDGRRGSLDWQFVGADSHGGADCVPRLLVDPVEEAELPGIEHD